MKRTLIPQSKLDRWTVSGALLGLIIGFSLYWNGYAKDPVPQLVGASLTLLILSYVAQDQVRNTGKPNLYADAIEQVARMGGQLARLSKFLEAERRRITETEDAIRRLVEEKTSLEPVVESHRDQVDAIMKAYTSRATTGAWKERAVSFALGAGASLLASYIYDYLRRKS